MRIPDWCFSVTGWIDKHGNKLELVLTTGAIVVAIILYYETKEQVDIAKKALWHQIVIDSLEDIRNRELDAETHVKDSMIIQDLKNSDVRAKAQADAYQELVK